MLFNSIALIRLRRFRKSNISSLFMVHLTEDQVSRYLEKRLTRMERVEFSEHLSICEQCRAQVIQSTEFQRFASNGIFALTGVTPERKFSPWRFRRLTGTERLAIDMRNHLCPAALAKEPKEPRDEEIEPQRAGRLDWSGSLWRRIFGGGTWGIATGAAAAIALLAIVWFTRSQEDGVKLVTIRDSNKELKIGAHGFIGTYLLESAESRQINTEIAQIVNDGKLTAPRAIRALQDEKPRQSQGNTPANDSFKLQRPVQTAVDTTTPLFQWTSRSKATGYLVNVVVDDRNNRQVAKSGVIPASGNETSLYQWRLPEDTPLRRGETYRWYVTALGSDDGGHSAAFDEPAAKFLVLSGGESENLAGLKTKAGGSQLVAGLLDLQAGLLDDAERKFDELRQTENQTEEGKSFLKKVITGVKTLKGNR
jgi:hypothetical protein